MPQFEYHSLLLVFDRLSGFLSAKPDAKSLEEINAQLNELGKEGWELTAVLPVSNGANPPQMSHGIHYFKRALTSE